jgi:hypothetical protein
VKYSPPLEAGSSSVTQEISRLLWNPNIPYPIQRMSSLESNLSHINPVYPAHASRYLGRSNNTSELEAPSDVSYNATYSPTVTVVRPRPCPTVSKCLFNTFAATLHMWSPSPPFKIWGQTTSWWQGIHLIWNVYQDRNLLLPQSNYNEYCVPP